MEQPYTLSWMRMDINTLMYVLALLEQKKSTNLTKKSTKDEEKRKDPLYTKYLEGDPTVGP
ncbi:unnamed protein product [Thlaspi arvense]|uniref:Uncharacterized protein n=1 Tax=Thlaspi arvense TaxID=13288 RepID=A0AAU9RZL7_THLAR|nr:unnamed protein product [Thlaspi arvense]